MGSAADRSGGSAGTTARLVAVVLGWGLIHPVFHRLKIRQIEGDVERVARGDKEVFMGFITDGELAKGSLVDYFKSPVQNMMNKDARGFYVVRFLFLHSDIQIVLSLPDIFAHHHNLNQTRHCPQKDLLIG